MTKIAFKSVDEYIASQPEPVRQVLSHVRHAVRTAVPGIQEAISYNMPTYKLNGKRLLYFAAWKHHYSIYGATQQMLILFGAELAPYKVDKGTIRFSTAEPVPIKLIERIAKFRAKEVAKPR